MIPDPSPQEQGAIAGMMTAVFLLAFGVLAAGLWLPAGHRLGWDGTGWLLAICLAVGWLAARAYTCFRPLYDRFQRRYRSRP